MVRIVVWLAGIVFLLNVPAASEEKITKDEKGRTRCAPPLVDEKFRNPWPAEWLESYYDRCHHAIETKGRAIKKPGGGTFGENEKSYYPEAMFAFLAGNRDIALKALQEGDNQVRDHAHTNGVDFYWCFTLKGQIRKYFYFGQYLDPAYKQKMFDGAKIWTEAEPLRRPHPVYGKGNPPPGEAWGPEAKGSWVDVRSTDNLRAMRDTSVYLMAEETGNEQTRLLYKEKLKTYVVALYHTGMTEWDSSNYHGHTLCPYHNLYDFARDPEVKALAKAALDILYTAGAYKYFRGAFGGPNLRDYGGLGLPFGSNVTHPLALMFGDTPVSDPAPDRDDLYHITSAYLPPEAVVNLGQKKIGKPVEMFSSKPPYKAWKPGDVFAPRYFETQFFGHSFMLGSCVSANTPQEWDGNAFRLIAFNGARGADIFAANTAPLAGKGSKKDGDQIGQYRNLIIWLSNIVEAKKTYYFVVPKSAQSEIEDGIWFFKYERTWLAVRPLNLGAYTEVTPVARDKKGNDVASARFKLERFLEASISGAGFAGFALEVGEQESHGDYAAFKTAVKSKSKLDASKLSSGEVTLSGADGKTLAFKHNTENDLPILARDGAAVDWTKRWDLYKPADGAGPVSLGWQQGTLRVEAGGKVFTSTVTAEGRVPLEK
ncbi:MAG TPA: hypothetical protein VEK08_03185 [Planctomycetota bacterium]|nr:hypothetical protein [Planctomycetota bacterium]